MIVVLPTIFTVAAADVLSEFSRALGGDLVTDAAAALGAGWAAALVSGALGLFQAESAGGADRRLTLAGAHAVSVAVSRTLASLGFVILTVTAGLMALWVTTGVAHPAHAAAALLGLALTYLAVGIIVGSLVRDALASSLLMVLVLLLDVFSGSGMSEDPAVYSISRPSADVLIRAGLGQASPPAEWVPALAFSGMALAASVAAFTWVARPRR